MSGISTHVLDTARGRPAAGLAVTLEIRGPDGGWHRLATAATDAGGRVARLLPDGRPLEAATYRIAFDTGGWFESRGEVGFYPEATVVFAIRDPEQHHHVPLLLSPYGYSTYRGS
jgi:5-hydroxyisourate hydrolase